MNLLSTRRSRVAPWLPLAMVSAFGCQEPQDSWVDFRDEIGPMPSSVFRASTEVEFQAFGTLSGDDDSDLNVRLVVTNLAADTLRYETGPCFFIVRAFASEEPSGRPLWDHRGRLQRTVYSMCTLQLLQGVAEPHGADTIKLIPEMARGYDRDFPRDAGSFWVIMNVEGRAHRVPVAVGDL